MKEEIFLKVAKEAALNAGKIIEEYFGKKQKIYIKGNISNFATQADLDAEESIIKSISANFPDHKIISEEMGENNNHSEYTWVIDPIDGTTGFEANLPFFVVSIGLLKKSELILGVIYWVSQNKLYYAQKGKGAYLNGKRIRVGKTKDLKQALIGFDFGHLNSRQRKHQNYFKPLMYKVRYPYVIAAVALLMALVAEGSLDGYCGDANIWDYAGAAIIIKEAGGKISDFQGEEIDWTKKRLQIATTNGLIHDELLEALKQ